jgi:hypothetical protein
VKRVAGIVLVALLALTVVAAVSGCGCQEEAVEQTTGQIDQAKDAVVKAQLMMIKTGVQAMIASTGQVPADASQATLGGFVDPWPTNPWTKAAMQAGDGVGDYVYTPGSGTSFTLAVHLSDGSTSAAP